MKKKRILLAISIVLVLYFLEYLYRWMQVPLLTDYFDNYMKNGLSLEQQEALKTIDTLKGAFILFPKDDDLVFQYSIMLDKMSKLEEQVAAFELLDNHKIGNKIITNVRVDGFRDYFSITGYQEDEIYYTRNIRTNWVPSQFLFCSKGGRTFIPKDKKNQKKLVIPFDYCHPVRWYKGFFIYTREDLWILKYIPFLVKGVGNKLFKY